MIVILRLNLFFHIEGLESLFVLFFFFLQKGTFEHLESEKGKLLVLFKIKVIG